MINQVSISGHLVRDPVYRQVGEKQTALLNFSVAVTKKRGEVEKTGFYDCKAWGHTAEAARSLVKGDAVIVSGELDFESWEDKESGARRSKVVIQATDIGRTLYRKKNPEATASPLAPAVNPSGPAEDDIPF